MTTSGARPGRASLPLLQGLWPIDRSRLPVDLIAGVTLAALAIPEVMGYATIAGMPVVTGLYTMLLPVLVFAVFGSSRHLVVGADSATAALLATGLAGLGVASGSTAYVELAALAALVCAVLLIAARVLRLGFIANFLSRSVLIGFLSGVGIQVAIGQVGDMFGVPATAGGTIERFVDTLREIPSETSIATLAVSSGVLATIVGLGRVDARIPGALVAVVGSIVLSGVLDLAAHGVTTLGPIPGGLPAIGLPTSVLTIENVSALVPLAFSMFIVILAQSAATSRAYAMRFGDRFDEDVDLVGLGLANVAAGVSGTFVVNGSPTKTEMVVDAGGRSQAAQLMCAAIIALVLIFLASLLAGLPHATLAAVVFLIGIRLVDIRGLSEIARLRRGEFTVAAITAITVIVAGVREGIILAIVLSIVEHLSHSYRPHDRLLVLDGTSITSAPLAAGTQVAPGVVVYRFGASVYYANASKLIAEVMSLVDAADPPLHTVILMASAVGDVDYSGADALRRIHDELAEKGITLVIAHLDPSVRVAFDAYGLTALLGQGNLYGEVPLPAIVARYERQASGPKGGSS